MGETKLPLGRPGNTLKMGIVGMPNQEFQLNLKL